MCRGEIQAVYNTLAETFRRDGKLLLCGNGGSAADADHWAGELLKGFGQLRPLSPAMPEGIPTEIADRLQWAFPVIPLTGFPALSTAFCNDVEPEYVFAQLTLALGRRGDELVCLSTSGNAANVCRAAEVARARGLHVLAFTGQTGGKLTDLADVCIRVPTTYTPHVQEFHLPIYHALCLMLEDDFDKTWNSGNTTECRKIEHRVPRYWTTPHVQYSET